MKNIFNIHYSFLLFLLLLLFSGYINYVCIFLGILITHELGHILVIYLFHYRIKKIFLYPLGGNIETNIDLLIPSRHLFFISIAGILFQSLLFLIIPESSSVNYQVFKMLNLSLILYNSIPIYPSDGYKILLSIFENIFSYKRCIFLLNILSFVFLFLFFYVTKSVLLFVFLYIMNIKRVLYFPYYYHQFLLERYLRKKTYKKKKYVVSLKNIYKSRENYIKCGREYQHENVLLRHYFEGN